MIRSRLCSEILLSLSRMECPNGRFTLSFFGMLPDFGIFLQN